MENKVFTDEVMAALVDYCNQDWGICCLEDKEANDYTVENNERILGSYITCNGKIWIITEADRSVTTILFPGEY